MLAYVFKFAEAKSNILTHEDSFFAKVVKIHTHSPKLLEGRLACLQPGRDVHYTPSDEDKRL